MAARGGGCTHPAYHEQKQKKLSALSEPERDVMEEEKSNPEAEGRHEMSFRDKFIGQVTFQSEGVDYA